MTVLELVLVFVVIPAAILLLIAAGTMGSKLSRGPRYRPGQRWEHEPVWWTANPDGVGELPLPGHDRVVDAQVGGARGTW